MTVALDERTAETMKGCFDKSLSWIAVDEMFCA